MGRSESTGVEERSGGHTVGMNSLWGVIAHVIAKTGWTWDYILTQVSWINIRMMLADAPQYQSTQNNTDVATEATDDDLDNMMTE